MKHAWASINVPRLARKFISEPSIIDDGSIVGTCSCTARWQGGHICHCGACHLTFTSVGPFDEHRTNGRCRTTEELTERGLAPSESGYWRRPRPLDTIPGADGVSQNKT